MSPAETQAAEVQAAADNAMLQGLMRIEEAAVKAAEPAQKQLEAMKVKDIEEAAKKEFEYVENNSTDHFKMMLNAEEMRQENELASMKGATTMAAQRTVHHAVETAMHWANNQARNYIALHANATMGEAVRTAENTAMIRQEATELTKGAIKSAAQALAVAKRAQDAVNMLPKDAMIRATVESKKSKQEQKVLNVEIQTIESNVRKLAKVARDGYQVALMTLNEANSAEITAKEALATSRGNAGKIEKLKTRAQAVSNKASKAKVALEKSRA